MRKAELMTKPWALIEDFVKRIEGEQDGSNRANQLWHL